MSFCRRYETFVKYGFIPTMGTKLFLKMDSSYNDKLNRVHDKQCNGGKRIYSCETVLNTITGNGGSFEVTNMKFIQRYIVINIVL